MNSWHRHTLRFAAVGIASNLFLYLLYLLGTGLGIGHKTAMTGLYLLGMVQSFALNSAWTFGYRGEISGATRRFIVVYALGYAVNLGMLKLFVDAMFLPHQAVQAVAIFVVAALMFVMQRHWVFAAAGTHAREPGVT